MANGAVPRSWHTDCLGPGIHVPDAEHGDVIVKVYRSLTDEEAIYINGCSPELRASAFHEWLVSSPGGEPKSFCGICNIVVNHEHTCGQKSIASSLASAELIDRRVGGALHILDVNVSLVAHSYPCNDRTRATYLDVDNIKDYMVSIGKCSTECNAFTARGLFWMSYSGNFRHRYLKVTFCCASADKIISSLMF